MNATTRHAARTVVALATLAVTATMLSACVVPPLPASGPRVETRHEVSDDVHAVRLETAGDVVVQLGDEPGLTITAPKSLSDRLTVEERRGVLVLGLRGPGWTSARVDYLLTVRSLDEVEVDGAGDVLADFSGASDVRVQVDGIGDVDASELDAESVTVRIDGAGDVHISGVARTGDYRVDGAGSIRASELELTDGSATLDGVGDIEVRATGTLAAEISGMGDIRVTGGATVTSTVSGFGDVHED